MGNKIIAVIDEDKKFLGEIDKVLTGSGYTSIMIDDALSALEITVRHKPDVILMELRMFSKNGFELANEINQVFESQRIPIIAMSSYLKDEFKFLFDICSINSYLRKPFNPLEVIWAIENVTEESKQLDGQSVIGNRINGEVKQSSLCD